MTLVAGTQVGPYVISSALGVGGMGEVFRASDTRLGRDVALKILPASFAREGERLQRFEQEARAVAALSHPNILAVFDIGQYEGSPYLVSELLEGETLRDILQRGPLTQRKAIDYGVQIAQGLAAAHEKQIVHRDLKPENIFITHDGRVKILDFGLAKLEPAITNEPDSIAPTRLQTSAGMVMGTASYMAPEQVRGDPCDPRTDIFAFGAVLYEMLTGQRLFHRGTAAETMTAVLNDHAPEITSDPAHPVSPALCRILQRCLEKAPEQRFQSAKDLSFALGTLSGSDVSASAVAIALSRKRPPMLWLAISLAFLAAAAATWFFVRRAAPDERLQFAIPVPGEVDQLAISRDGSLLAFVAPEENSGLPMLFVQRIGSPSATLMPGTENASYPFWSPDARNVAFFANGKLYRMPATGGPPQALTRVDSPRGGSWGSRDVILFAPYAGSAIWRINADGSGATNVTDSIRTNADLTHRWPTFLPDGNRFLFWAGNFGNDPNDHSSGIYVSSLDKKERNLLILGRSSFAVGRDHIYYADSERQLVSQPFDSAKAAISGVPVVIAGIVRYQTSTYWAAITAAANGTLIYDSSTGASRSALTWMDRSGKVLGTLGDPGVIANPSLSFDGAKVAVDISDERANNVDIWLLNIGDNGTRRFTFEPVEEAAATFSRDGARIAYRSAVGVGTALFIKPADGLKPAKNVFSAPFDDDVITNAWSPDGKQVLSTLSTDTGSHMLLTPSEGGPSTPFMAGTGSQTNGQFSPDGKWVAYASDESGNWEIYVTTFPSGAGKWQISRAGGTEPRWSRDGKEIFFLAPKGILSVASVETGSGFSSSTPTTLFQTRARPAISSTDLFSYDVSRDGNRILVNRYVKPERPYPLTIVLNGGK
jgi:eukaryotic-like serine/threonine-protein kinase